MNDISTGITSDELDIHKWLRYEKPCHKGICKTFRTLNMLNTEEQMFFYWCACQGLMEESIQCHHCFKTSDNPVKHKGPHIEVTCGKCQRHIKFIKKTDCGLNQRNKQKSRANQYVIKPAIRARILLRDKGTCQLCGATNTQMHVDHKQSVNHAIKQGWQSTDINSDNNLWTLCETCNLGKKANCIPPCQQCDPQWKEVFQ